jgi:serine/threonine protein kinase
LKDEILVQRELSQKSNSIVKILKVYETDKDIKILMDLCQGGNLTQLIKKRKAIKEAEARVISAQLLLTVDLLSLRQITHRDLKP